ncbi:tetratricopeptide repeat protein [Psychrobacter glacincola]|uniref:tetratricopeptide repeat protein n=1 Tax=Psychrobacter glacincola TaxID=56810 RepID=UPI0039AE96C1
MSSSPLTPLDYIAAGYWQDFLARHAVAGGIAYEVDLHHCSLDESLASLQRLDTLMSQIRRDMVKTGIWDEATLLKDERYRNFMVFLAFYAGRVLARQWQQSPRWFGQFELDTRYPELTLTPDDFYQHMAMFYGANINTKNSSDKGNIPLFFALEPIGMRLFGHIDRTFKSAQGIQVASGLYQAVSTRLPKALSDKPHLVDTTMAALANAEITDKPNTEIVNEKIAIDKISPENSGYATDVENTKITNSEATPIEVAKPKPVVKVVIKEPPTPEMFTQLLTELHEIEVTQSAGETEYEQACKVLEQFERHIAKQEKPRDQVVFSEMHLQAKQQALLGLKVAADTGNSAAMLRLAMYELLGEGLIANEGADKAVSIEAGVEWVKQAASKNDSRAQRLLSKMYYQGVGVIQDLKVGRYWLEQAAENGHIEAASLLGQWQQAQVLISTQKQEQHSLKRYQLLFAVIIVIALLIIILV